MTDRPIIFSAPMIRALLAGTKTQMRRILKLTVSGGPIYERPDMGGWEPTTIGGGGCFTFVKGEKVPVQESVGIWHRTTGVCMSAPYQVGDRLWVRESVAAEEIDSGELDEGADGVRYIATNDFERIEDSIEAADRWLQLFYYRADDPIQCGKKVPSVHMPRWTSRLTLIVERVRVERLQDISEEEAEAEGCESEIWDMALACRDYSKENGWFQMWGENCGETYVPFEQIWRASFRSLWDSINADRASWESNPWVVAISFRCIKLNIDKT